MSLRVRDKVRPFKQSMNLGAIYIEFSDGFNLALDSSYYYLSVTDNNNATVYPMIQFINKLRMDHRVRRMTKAYYKAYNVEDPNSGEVVWVDLNQAVLQSANAISLLDYQTMLKQAYNLRSIAKVDVKNINAVEYTERVLRKNLDGTTRYDYIVHNIDKFDGAGNFDESIAPIKNFSMRDRSKVTISQYNSKQPTLLNAYHLKNDLKIDLSADSTDNLNNILVWVGGIFTQYNKLDDKSIFIDNAKSLLDTRVVGYTGVEPMVAVPFDDKYGHMASFLHDVDRADVRVDYDVKIFKWDNVKVSDWFRPIMTDYGSYHYVFNAPAEDIVKDIDYVKSIYFDHDIDKNHILMCDGVIVDKKTYKVEGSKITMYTNFTKILDIINDAAKEFGFDNVNFTSIVERYLPGGDSYSIVEFSHINPAKKIHLNISDNCLRNYPYPYHVTFNELAHGDLVLLDGMYEKYLIHDRNIIKYPYTKWMVRYKDKNLLSDTRVERLWFTVDDDVYGTVLDGEVTPVL